MPKTVQLPELKRMPDRLGGHVIYPYGAESICPYHQFCAYTGDEEDRCPQCHSHIDVGCAHTEDGFGGLPPGRSRPCLCRRCDEMFSSITSFDIHKGTNGRCLNPERRGLILIDANGWLMWAKPGSPPARD